MSVGPNNTLSVTGLSLSLFRKVYAISTGCGDRVDLLIGSSARNHNFHTVSDLKVYRIEMTTTSYENNL